MLDGGLRTDWVVKVVLDVVTVSTLVYADKVAARCAARFPSRLAYSTPQIFQPHTPQS